MCIRDRITGFDIQPVHPGSLLQPLLKHRRPLGRLTAQPGQVMPVHRHTGGVDQIGLEGLFHALLAVETHNLQALLLLQEKPGGQQIPGRNLHPVKIAAAVAGMLSPPHTARSPSPESGGQSCRATPAAPSIPRRYIPAHQRAARTPPPGKGGAPPPPNPPRE